MNGGLAAHGELGEASGRRPVLFELADAVLHGVTLLVQLRVHYQARTENWGGHMIWRRIQKRSGVQTPGQPPDLRVFGQGMARARASIADIQDVLGLESDKMARQYAWDARSFAAANLMTKYSLAG